VRRQRTFRFLPTSHAPQHATPIVRGISSAGRAPGLQPGGHRFEPGILHFVYLAKASGLCARLGPDGPASQRTMWQRPPAFALSWARWPNGPACNDSSLVVRLEGWLSGNAPDTSPRLERGWPRERRSTGGKPKGGRPAASTARFFDN
jgi:hypothetical protein